MAKCNQLTSLPFKGLRVSNCFCLSLNLNISRLQKIYIVGRNASIDQVALIRNRVDF